jgi:hypothetical protein
VVRIQGASPSEAAEVLEDSVSTVNRRLKGGLQSLAATLEDLYPGGEAPAASSAVPDREENAQLD